jgi:hypothetical protein
VLWSRGEQAQAREVWQQGTALEPDNALLKRTVERLDR